MIYKPLLQKAKGWRITPIPIGTLFEPWVFDEADSRFGCLPLPLFGYFTRIFHECTEYTDVAVVDDDCLFCRSGVSFLSFADFNLLNKQVQKLIGQLVNLCVAFDLINEPCDIGDVSPKLFNPFNSLRDLFLQAVLFPVVVGRQHMELRRLRRVLPTRREKSSTLMPRGYTATHDTTLCQRLPSFLYKYSILVLIMSEPVHLSDICDTIKQIYVEVNDVAVSYNKLWKLLIDMKMKKKDLQAAANISASLITKLGRDEPVTTTVLMKICSALNCDIGDIMEIIQEEQNGGK